MIKKQEGFDYENSSKENHQTHINGRYPFFTYGLPCVSGADDHVGRQEEQKGRHPGAGDRHRRRIKEIRSADMMKRSGYGS